MTNTNVIQIQRVDYTTTTVSGVCSKLETHSNPFINCFSLILVWCEAFDGGGRQGGPEENLGCIGRPGRSVDGEGVIWMEAVVHP